MKRFLPWIKASCRWWFIDLWFVWLTIFPVGLIFFLSGALEDRLRYSGLISQLLGIATVALGLSEKGRLFNRQVSGYFRESWKRHPRLVEHNTSYRLLVSALACQVGRPGFRCGAVLRPVHQYKGVWMPWNRILRPFGLSQTRQRRSFKMEQRNRTEAVKVEREAQSVGHRQTQHAGQQTCGWGTTCLSGWEFSGLSWV